MSRYFCTIFLWWKIMNFLVPQWDYDFLSYFWEILYQNGTWRASQRLQMHKNDRARHEINEKVIRRIASPIPPAVNNFQLRPAAEGKWFLRCRLHNYCARLRFSTQPMNAPGDTAHPLADLPHGASKLIAKLHKSMATAQRSRSARSHQSALWGSSIMHDVVCVLYWLDGSVCIKHSAERCGPLLVGELD